MLLEGEEASGPAVPLPGGGNSLWQLPLTSGATVAFALFQAPSSSSSSTSSGSSSSGAAAAVRVASAKKGGSIGAVVLPSSGAEAGGGSTSGSSASAQQRLFVSTVANTADVSSAAAAAPAPAAAVAQLFEVTSGGTVKEVEDASPAQGPTDWDASSHGAFLLGACFPHVVLKRDGTCIVYYIFVNNRKCRRKVQILFSVLLFIVLCSCFHLLLKREQWHGVYFACCSTASARAHYCLMLACVLT